MDRCVKDDIKNSLQLPSTDLIRSSKHSHMNTTRNHPDEKVSYLCQICGRVSDSLEESLAHTQSHLIPLVTRRGSKKGVHEITERTSKNVDKRTCDQLQREYEIKQANNFIETGKLESNMNKNKSHSCSTSVTTHSMQTRLKKQNKLYSLKNHKITDDLIVDAESNTMSKKHHRGNLEKKRETLDSFSTCNNEISEKTANSSCLTKQRRSADGTVDKSRGISISESNRDRLEMNSKKVKETTNMSQCKARGHGMVTRYKNCKMNYVCIEKAAHRCKGDNQQKSRSSACNSSKTVSGTEKNMMPNNSPIKNKPCTEKNMMLINSTNKNKPSTINPLVMLSELASQNKKIKLKSSQAVKLEINTLQYKMSPSSLWKKSEEINVLEEHTSDRNASIRFMNNGNLSSNCFVVKCTNDKLQNTDMSPNTKIHQKQTPQFCSENTNENNVTFLNKHDALTYSKPKENHQVVSALGQVTESVLLRNKSVISIDTKDAPTIDSGQDLSVVSAVAPVFTVDKDDIVPDCEEGQHSSVINRTEYKDERAEKNSKINIIKRQRYKDEKVKKNQKKIPAIKYRCDKCFSFFNTTIDLKEHKKICGTTKFVPSEKDTDPLIGAMVPQNVGSSDFVENNLQRGVENQSFSEAGTDRQTCDNFKHQIILTGVNDFKCVLCGKLFTENNEIQGSIVEEVDEISKIGKDNAYNFEQENNDEIVTSGSAIESNLPCEDGVARSKISLQDETVVQNRTLFENTDNLLMCEICGRFFSRKDSLSIHKRIHTGYKPFPCKLCSKSFRDKYSYLCHFAKHTGVRPYKCLKCDKSYVMRKQLIKHCLVHTGRRPFQCTLCAKTFTFLDNLKAHEKIHKRIKKPQCVICKDMFIDETEMNIHKKKHFTTELVLPKDVDFGHVIPDFKQNMVPALDASCQILGVVNCDICGKSFRNDKNLRRHRKNHQNKKLYECSVCGLTFRQSHVLKLHRWKHAGVNLFKCGDCRMIFKSPVSLMSHKKERPNTLMKCSVCAEAFTNRCALRAHRLSHGVHDFYSCQYCQKTFRMEKNLQKHVKSHIENVQVENHQTEMPLEIEYDLIQSDSIPDILPTLEDDMLGKTSINVPQTSSQKIDNSVFLEQHEMLSVAPFISNLCDVESETLIIQSEMDTGDDDVLTGASHVQTNMEVPDNVSETNTTIVQSEISNLVSAESSGDSVYLFFTDNNIETNDINFIVDKTKQIDAFYETQENSTTEKINLDVNVLECVNDSDKSKSTLIPYQQPLVVLTEPDKTEQLTTEYSIAPEFVQQAMRLDKALDKQTKFVAETGPKPPEDIPQDNVPVFQDKSDAQVRHTIETFCDTSQSNLLRYGNEELPDNTGISESFSCPVPCEKTSFPLTDHNSPVEHREIDNNSLVSAENVPVDDYTIQSDIQQLEFLSNSKHDETSVSKGPNSVSLHTKKKIGKRKCSICNEEFSQRKQLMEHLNTHVNVEFSCASCDLKCNSHSEWISHQKEVHGLVIDDIVGTQKSSGLLSCDHCGRNFNKRDNLNRHILTHTHEKPFRCLECGKTFSQSSGLNTHKSTHTNERNFNCSVCSAKFKRKSNLQSHLKTHGTEKPYSCEICGKSFRERSFLKNHMFTHSEDKSHHCEFCEKSFADRSLLVKHQRLHTEKFLCVICEKTFTRGSSLREHLKRSHVDGPSASCDICGKIFRNAVCLKKHKFSHDKAKGRIDNVYLVIH